MENINIASLLVMLPTAPGHEGLHVSQDAVQVAIVLLQSLHDAVILLINFPDIVCNGHQEFVIISLLLLLFPGIFCIPDNLKVLPRYKLLLLLFSGNFCFFQIGSF